MFCSKCGRELEEGSSFCVHCGEKITNTATKSALKIGDIKNILKSRKVIKYAIVGVVIVFVIILISYFNSVSYIEKKLARETWYETPDYDNGVWRGSIAEFHLNGDTEIEYYIKSPYIYYGEEWSGGDVESPNWEIMEDKTLYFDGEYYEWGDEWYLRGDTLKIGDSIYSATNTHEYD